jgi:hypothetical protein
MELVRQIRSVQEKAEFRSKLRLASWRSASYGKEKFFIDSLAGVAKFLISDRLVKNVIHSDCHSPSRY